MSCFKCNGVEFRTDLKKLCNNSELGLFLEHNLGCFKRKGTSQNVSRQDFFHSCQQKCAHENYFGVRLTEDAFRQVNNSF